MLHWLDELQDEYQAQVASRVQANGNEAFILRLGRAYSGEPAEIMADAVALYVRENKFFPKTAELQPYVRRAREDARGAVAFADIGRQLRYGRFGHGPYSDADILAWEQARGTMPPDAGLGSEWLNGRLRANTQKETA